MSDRLTELLEIRDLAASAESLAGNVAFNKLFESFQQSRRDMFYERNMKSAHDLEVARELLLESEITRSFLDYLDGLMAEYENVRDELESALFEKENQ